LKILFRFDVRQMQRAVTEFLSLERVPPINIFKTLEKVLWGCSIIALF